MAGINFKHCMIILGVFILHGGSGQTVTSPGGAVALDPAATPNMRTDITDTVMALLNETGYSGSANDANVQEIVDMMMNGTVPTDADLIRLGFIPQPPPDQATTPPPYSIGGVPPVVDPSISFPAAGQPGSPTASQVDLSGFPPGGLSMAGFPSSPTMGGSLPAPQSGSSSGSGTGSAGSDPFSGMLSGLGSPPAASGVPSFQTLLGAPGTTPKPTLADPFGLNALPPIPSAQMPLPLPLPVPNMGLGDPNALAPKPFPGMGPIGGLGTPGSTVDLLGSLGPVPGGLGNTPSLPPTGILDAQQNQRNQQNGMLSNPMMMMMMMNPEMMDTMMSGENPMMMYLMMQQMNKRPQRPQPTGAGMGGPMGGPFGGPMGGPMGGFGGMPGGITGGLPFPGSSPMGMGPGGGLDLMNPLGTGAGMAPMDMAGLGGLGAQLGPAPGTPGATPMDLIQGSLTSPIGPAGGPADMNPLLNMVNPAATGPLPGGAPLTDPFGAAIG